MFLGFSWKSKIFLYNFPVLAVIIYQSDIMDRKQRRKCAACGVPLEGFGYKYIAKPMFGIRPSTKKAGICNKCEKKR